MPVRIDEVQNGGEQGSIEPWYYQFWPWFIIALPLSVVIAGFITLGIALHHRDSRVDIPFLDDGLVRVSDRAALRTAAHYDMSATVTVVPNQGDESVASVSVMHSETVLVSLSRLIFLHPVSERHDLEYFSDPTDGNATVSMQSRIYRLPKESGLALQPGWWNITLHGRVNQVVENNTAGSLWRLMGRCRVPKTLEVQCVLNSGNPDE